MRKMKKMVLTISNSLDLLRWKNLDLIIPYDSMVSLSNGVKKVMR